MRINNIDVLITKIDSKEKYLMISFLDMATGDVFEVLEKDLELSSSKYGLKLEIAEVKENKGAI